MQSKCNLLSYMTLENFSDPKFSNKYHQVNTNTNIIGLLWD